jgi:hypothetical protein
MRRALVSGALSAVIVVAAVVPVLAWWSRLPAEIAVHWDVHGDPDGHMSRIAGLGWPVSLAVVGAVVVAVAARRAGATAVPVAVLAGFFAGLLGVIALVTVLANRDAPQWQEADLPAPAAGLIVAGGLTTAGAVVGGLRPHWLRPLPRQLASPPAHTGERVAWVGGCHSSWMLTGTTAALALAAMALAITGARLAAAGLATLAVVLFLAFRSVRVLIGAHGVRVSSGAGWPQVTIPLASIAGTEAISLDPLRWGGWGYRGSLHLAGRAAWVLRRGPALRLDLTDGRSFAVTIDDADEASAVVNGWLARSPSASS